MGPKISEAKTPPLRKPASPFSLPSSTLTPLSPFFSALSLLLNTSFSLIRTQKKSLLNPQVPAPKPLSEICISVLSLLSACSKFKHAYGGRMCLWSPCASPWRALLCLSLSPRQLLFLLYAASLSLSSLHLTLLLPICLSLSHLLPVCKPPILLSHVQMCTRWMCKHAWANTHLYAGTQPCTCIHKCTNSCTQTVSGHIGAHTQTLTVAEWFSPAQQHIAYMQSHSPY